MSNTRRTGLKNLYRDEFLRSRAWFARRERWFRDHGRAGRVPCAACGTVGSKSDLELHHIDYRGVRIIRGEWQAWEDDDDLIALHPYCHELLHRLIDRDIILAKHRTRRQASAHALHALQQKLRPVKDAS
ncbi:HNH endonuclease [Microbacterium aerolatum]|uniref:HNH endonuclease signature motif containing protein n=1 Tax=Microbacterium aerolatum TaxID=153731 RepID=UPI0020009A86|nr:HNH endonuclease signature motif containing protein [Microbacterium aerolatum]MCK3769390.1 HNH endonuclease [Microbacterium aerolatum]